MVEIEKGKGKTKKKRMEKMMTLTKTETSMVQDWLNKRHKTAEKLDWQTVLCFASFLLVYLVYILYFNGLAPHIVRLTSTTTAMQPTVGKASERASEREERNKTTAFSFFF